VPPAQSFSLWFSKESDYLYGKKQKSETNTVSLSLQTSFGARGRTPALPLSSVMSKASSSLPHLLSFFKTLNALLFRNHRTILQKRTHLNVRTTALTFRNHCTLKLLYAVNYLFNCFHPLAGMRISMFSLPSVK